ncbi:MAG: outer membrane protein transport protein [Myxococcota bacterium]
MKYAAAGVGALGYGALCAAMAGWVCVGLCSAAQADETHYENFRFGQTAIGYGGAVVGFMTEPEASFYNPGGLAFLERSRFSGSMNFLGRDRRMITRWISGEGVGLESEDGVSESFLALPNSSAVVKTFLGGRHALGFSTFLVGNTQESFEARATFDLGVGTEQLDFVERLTDRTVFTGPSYALRLSEEWGVGLSVFYARRTLSRFDQWTTRLREEDDPTGVAYQENQERVDTQDGALIMKVGGLWRVTPRWSLGASVSTPSIRLHGRGRYYFRTVDTGVEEILAELDGETVEEDSLDTFNEVEKKVRARTQYPWMLALGASYGVEGSWRLSTGLNVWMPLTYTRLQVQETELAEGSTFVSFVPRIERNLTVNGSLGGEVLLGERWPLRAGVFTNLASSPKLEQERYRVPQQDHVNLYGASISIGYIDDAATINLGVETQFGSGHETTLDASFTSDTEIFLRRERQHARVLFLVSGALRFAGVQAKQIIENDRDRP